MQLPDLQICIHASALLTVELMSWQGWPDAGCPGD